MRLAKDENSVLYVCLDGSDIDTIYDRYKLSLSEYKLYKIVKYDTDGSVFISCNSKLYLIGTIPMQGL